MKWLVTVLIVVVSSLFVDVSIYLRMWSQSFSSVLTLHALRFFLGDAKSDECRRSAEESE